jgi:uncharacterized lipoprotein NlpE involved in copper resistance
MKKQTIMLLVMIFSLTACQNKKAREFVLPKILIFIKNCKTDIAGFVLAVTFYLIFYADI